MIYQFKTIKDYLKAELESRIEKNPRYSLRAFARALDVHPAELSLVLRGERTLSYNSCQKVMNNLVLSPSQCRHFLEILQNEKLGLQLSTQDESTLGTLQVEKFSKVSKWYHFAILNLVETKNFQWTPSFISRRLGISTIEAGLAMQDLVAEGLVNLTDSKTKKRNLEVVRVQTKFPSSVIRQYHEQHIKKSLTALQEIPAAQREYQSVGISISISDLPKIKSFIDKFTDEFLEMFHNPDGNEIYQLQMCFFPLTNVEDAKVANKNESDARF